MTKGNLTNFACFRGLLACEYNPLQKKRSHRQCSDLSGVLWQYDAVVPET